MAKSDSQNHVINYGVYIFVWLSLLVLTGLTITVAGAHLGSFSVLTAVLIAGLKSFLVLFFFMHLKYEIGAFRIMVFVALITLVIFIGFTFFDVSYR